MKSTKHWKFTTKCLYFVCFFFKCKQWNMKFAKTASKKFGKNSFSTVFQCKRIKIFVRSFFPFWYSRISNWNAKKSWIWLHDGEWPICNKQQRHKSAERNKKNRRAWLRNEETRGKKRKKNSFIFIVSNVFVYSPREKSHIKCGAKKKALNLFPAKHTKQNNHNYDSVWLFFLFNSNVW